MPVTLRARSIGLALAAFGLAFSAASGRAEIDFEGPRLVLPGALTRQMEVADVDGDGVPDIWFVDQAMCRVSVLRGDGTGDFTETFRLDRRPWETSSAVAGDFDENGTLDLAVTVLPNHRFVIFLGAGDGTFVETGGFDTGTLPRSITAADFDGDGHLDVSVLHSGSPNLSIHIGDGSGSFGPVLPRLLSGAVSVVPGDFDGDGDADLFSARSSGCNFFMNNGTGAFVLGGQLATTVVQPRAMDMHGDGAVDVVGAGAILFCKPGEITPAPFSPPTNASHFDVFDWDGDGLFDFIGRRTTTGDVTVRLGDGVRELPILRTANTLRYPMGIRALDADGDGVPDLLLSSARFASPQRGQGDIAILRGRPDGSWDEDLRAPLPSDDHDVAAVFDWNEDGLADLVTTLRGGRVVLFAGNGTGGFAETGRFDSRLELGATTRPGVRAADMDSDGRTDLVLFRPTEARFEVQYGLGPEGFRPGAVVDALHPRTFWVQLADLDLDGLVDVLLSDEDRREIVVFRALAGESFEAESGRRISMRQGTAHLSDFDADGFVDLLLCCSSRLGRFVAFLAGDGAGGFEGPREHSLEGETISRIWHGNFDGEPGQELIAETSNGRPLLLKGDWRENVELFDRLDFVRPSLVADVDFDGRDDIISITDDGNVLIARSEERVLTPRIPGDPGLRFGPAATYVLPEAFGSRIVRHTDLDGDGRPDLLVKIGAQPPALHTWLGRGADPFMFRRGTVNAGAGPVTDVLFVNGSAGVGDERVVSVNFAEPPFARVDLPPAFAPGAVAPFALYLWPGEPTRSTITALLSGLGVMGFPSPLSFESPQAEVVWNTLSARRVGDGRPMFGSPNRVSTPAPTLDFELLGDAGRTGSFFLQGIIRDPAALRGGLSVTNGVVIRVAAE